MGTSCSKKKKAIRTSQVLNSKIQQEETQTDLILYLQQFINDEESNTFKNNIKKYQGIEFLEVGFDSKDISFRSLQIIGESFLYIPYLKVVKLNVKLNKFSAIESLHVSSILTNTCIRKLVITTQKKQEEENSKIKHFFENSNKFECLFVRLDCQSFDNESVELLFQPFIQLPASKVLLQVLHLNLQNHCIHNGGSVVLSQALKLQVYLKDIAINLQNNNIDTEGALYLMDCVNEMQFLQSYALGLENNRIKTLCESSEDSQKYNKLTELTSFTLNLSYNKINDSVLSVLLKPMKLFENAQSLQLNFTSNQIDFKGINQLSDQFKLFKNLKNVKILLGGNLIQQTGANLIYSSLLSIPNLTSLSLGLEKNQILEYVLPQSQSLNANLKLLDINLGENTLSENGAHSFCSEIQKFNHLNTIKLRLNKISEKFPIDNFLNLILNLKELSQLYLDLSDINPNEILILIQACQKITKLSILSLILRTNINFDLRDIAKDIKKLDRVKTFKFNLRARQLWRSDQIYNILKIFKKLKRLVIKQINIE